MKYHGSCHCGRVAFDVQGELKEALSCNCSICQRKGSLLWFVPQSQFELQTSEDALATYTFNKHRIEHLFCSTCGIHAFARGKSPNGAAIAAVNIRSLENLDLDSVPVKRYDGRSL